MTDGRSWDGLAVQRSGVGPQVLWVHGYTMRASVFRPLWRALPSWRHVGVDLPFHGGSRALRPGESRADVADLLVAKASAEGIRHVVGLSLGTVFVVEMALRHPGSFSSWALAAPALAGMPHEPAVRERYAQLGLLYHTHGVGSPLVELWMRDPPGIFAGVNARPAVRRRLRQVIDAHGWTELAAAEWPRLFEGEQRPEHLADIRGSLLLLIGDRDLLSHRICARAVAAAVPRSRVEVIAGCGHLPLLEAPETVAHLIDAHLRSVRC